MPIRPENRARYPKDWKLISSYIRRVRARSRCEWCGVENGALGFRDVESGEFWPLDRMNEARVWGLTLRKTPTKIVLTVAHLNHTLEDCTRDNLRALCQRCHLNYDRHNHRANLRETIRKRKGLLELFIQR